MAAEHYDDEAISAADVMIKVSARGGLLPAEATLDSAEQARNGLGRLYLVVPRRRTLEHGRHAAAFRASFRAKRKRLRRPAGAALMPRYYFMTAAPAAARRQRHASDDIAMSSFTPLASDAARTSMRAPCTGAPASDQAACGAAMAMRCCHWRRRERARRLTAKRASMGGERTLSPEAKRESRFADWRHEAEMPMNDASTAAPALALIATSASSIQRVVAISPRIAHHAGGETFSWRLRRFPRRAFSRSVIADGFFEAPRGPARSNTVHISQIRIASAGRRPP